MNKWSPKSIVLGLYHLVFGVILLSNFRFDRWLMGWDGLYPELNIPLNIIRGLTAGWQEYYGAGLVGGHGFAATLPHTLIIGLLSVVLPQHLVREVFLFLCYYLGGLGMLFVSHKFITSVFKTPEHRTHSYRWYVSLVAALYYLLNLGTIQTFYLPLEAFTVHFAAFPWLTYSLMLLLEKLTRKRVAVFAIILFLASIQGFIPAVFVAYAVSLIMITGTYLILQRSKQAFLKIITIWTCVIAANAYWLGPVGYFTITSSKEYVSAYNNIISTPEFIAKSMKFGTLPEVALLRSLSWDTHELGGAIMQPWITHFHMPLVPMIGYGFFILASIGLLTVLVKKRSAVAWGLALSFVYFFGSLAIDTFPFSGITHLIQSHSPSLMQVFRTTFTKFGVGMSFHYALFVALGLYAFMVMIKRTLPKIPVRAVPILASVLLVIYALPVWQKGLIYQKLFVTLPGQYVQLIQYVNTLPEGRIADFPQDCAEGWYNELWGYFGSGFLWYGVNKPIMARAFDVWSHNNENYYWELSTALRQQNYTAVENVLTKYNVRYIIYDQNITHCRSQKGFTSSLDFRNYLDAGTAFTKRASFSAQNVLPITIYERKTKTSNSYIRLTPNLPNGPVALYADSDPIYATVGTYVSDTRLSSSVFSKRGEPIPVSLVDQLPLAPIASVSAITSERVPCSQKEISDGSVFASKEENGDTLRLITTNTQLCQSISFNAINTSLAYVIAISSRHIAGEPLNISVTNKGRPVGLDISLSKQGIMHEDYYLLPPTFPSEVAYTVTVENASYNQTTTINDIGDMRLYAYPSAPIPDISPPSHDLVMQPLISYIPVSHTISGLYIIDLPPDTSAQYLLLSQSFDNGWRAFDLSTRRQLARHVLINNWENGWELPATPSPGNHPTTIIIFFLPQLLEYAGLGCFGIMICLIGWKRLSERDNIKVTQPN